MSSEKTEFMRDSNVHIDERFLAAFPQVFAAGDDRLRELLGGGKVLELDAGERVFEVGMPCQNYLLVIKGTVRVQLLASNGREVTLYRVSPGESCVLTTSCMLGGDAYPAFAQTETAVSAFVLAAKHFQRALDQSSVFRRFVFENLGARLAEVISRFEETLLGDINSRLARVLGARANQERMVAATHQELAADLGTAREVVSRHLKGFERSGWVLLGRGHLVIVNPLALERLAGLPE